MSQSGSLGGADLVTELVTRSFEADLKKLETTVLSSVKTMSAAFDNVISPKAFSGAKGDVQALSGVLKPLETQLKNVSVEGSKVGDGLGVSAGKAKKAVDPLEASILSLKNETQSYRNIVEATDVSNADAVKNFSRLKTEALELAKGLDADSAQLKQISGVSAQASRSISTLTGQTTKLGFSGNTVVGVTASMRTGFVGLAGAIGPLLGGAGFVGLSRISGDLATKANAINVSYDILNLTLERTGQSSEGAQSAITRVSTTLGVAEGQVVDYITQLSRVGFTTDQAAEALIAGGASALAFGKTAAQGLDSVSSALVTQNSQALNTIGIAENIGKAMSDAADGAAKYGEEASSQAAAEAGLQVILKATGAEVDSLDKLTGGLAGSQNEVATAAFNAKQRFGEMLIPIETLKNEALAGLLNSFDKLPDATQSSVVGIGGVTAGTAALATGMIGLRAAMLPLFAPPAGLIIIGIAAAAALGTAIFQAAQKHEDAADKVSRLKTEAQNIVPALDGIKTATSKQQLLGNIETLAETMDGDAKTAFVSYAQTAVDSAKTTGEAVLGIMQGIAVARKSILEDAVRAQETLLKDLERNQQESQTQFNISTATGGTGKESSAITRLQSDLSEARALVTESEQAITKAVAAGNAERETYFRQQLEQDKALVTQIIGEIGKELDNTPAGRLNYDTSQAEQATRDLRGLQGQLDELNQLVETGTSEQIEAYFSRGAEGALKLSASTEPAATGVTTVGTAADKTATQFETAMNAATAWATRLTREAQQNVKPAAEVIGTFKDRVVELQKEQERLAKAGLAGGKQYDLAEQKISLLTGAIDELSGSQSKAENSGNDLSTSLGQLADKSFHAGDAERERVAQVIKSVDAQNAADAAVKSVIGGVDAYTTKNREAQDRLENLTSVTEYYTREVESSYDPLDAQIKQNKTNITVLGDVMKAQSDWNERLKISNKDLPKTVDYTNDFSTALSKLNANAQDVTGAFDGVDDITGGMEDAAAEAKLLGEEFDSSGTETKLLEDKIKSLLERSVDPASNRVQGLSKRLIELKEKTEQAKESNEFLADALGKLQDGSALSYDELQNLRAGLEEVADGSGKAADEAEGLIVKLDAIGESKLAGYVLTELGQLATDALTNVEGLGQDGQIALGAFSGAATAAGAALSDGFNGTQDAFGIVSGLIDGVAAQLGDDVPSEVHVAASAIGGVFSGAAAGAQFGPWGALAGGVIGGISGLFGGMAEEQEKNRKAQEEFNAELQNTYEITTDIADQNKEGKTKSETSVLNSKLDYAESSGDYKGKKGEGKLAFAQLEIDLVDGFQSFQDTVADISKRRTTLAIEIKSIEKELADGVSASGATLTEGMRADRQKQLGDLLTEQGKLDTEYQNYYEAFGYEVGKLLEGTDEIAKQLGISQDELYTALLTGNDEILGQLTSEQQDALRYSLIAYYQAFGELPPGAEKAAEQLGLSTETLVAELSASDTSLGTAATNGTTATRQGVADLNQQLLDFFGPEKSAEIRAMILGLYNDQATALGEGDQTLATTATGADAGPAALGGILDQVTALLGDKAGPVIDLINQTYADMGGAVGTSTTTLSTQATGSSTTVSGDLSGIFTSAKNAITATAPGATSALTTALSGIRTGLSNEGDPLARSLKDQEDALAERNKQLFLEQEIMAGKHGPEAKAALEAQIAAERKALYDSVYGSGGLSPFLSTTQGTLSSALGSFFTTQGTTVTNKGGGLVGDIDDIATKISRAMSGLASASTPPKGIRKLAVGSGRGKVPALASGGLVKRPTFALVGEAGPELVVPLNKLHGLIQTALGEMSVPVKGGFDVSGASKDIVRSISQAGKAEARAYRAAGSAKASGIASETEQVQRALAVADKKQQAFLKKYGRKKVRANDEQKKAYAENKKALLAFERETFDLIDGRALTGYNIKGHKDGFLDGLLGPLLGGKVNLIEGLTDKQQGIIDFAQQVGTSLEQSVFSGVSAGLKTAVKGGVPDLKGITEGIFDNVADSLIGKLQTQVLASALGPLLTDITADITRGNVAGAAKGVQKIAGKLPGLISNFQKLLSPLTGAYSALGLGQKDETQRGEVITIESPIADLSSITELLSQTRSLTTPGAISQTALSGAAPTITALPSYQAQQEAMNVPMFNTAVNTLYDGAVRLDRAAARLESLFKSRGNVITDAARGKGVSVFNLT